MNLFVLNPSIISSSRKIISFSLLGSKLEKTHAMMAVLFLAFLVSREVQARDGQVARRTTGGAELITPSASDKPSDTVDSLDMSRRAAG